MKRYLKHLLSSWWDPHISAELMILSVCVQTDLVSTIGESVALGVAGVIFWGDSNYASSHVSLCPNQSLH